MKLFGRILAILIAGVISVLAVQQIIRRMYDRFHIKYITLPSVEDPDDNAAAGGR